MTDETLTPSFDGDYVTYGGRTMLRVRGADDLEPAPGQGQEPVTPPAPEPPEGTTPPPAQPGPFDETFDPSTLPDELQAGWNQLRGDYTRKTQSLAEQRREAEGAMAFLQLLQDPDTQVEALRALGMQQAPSDQEYDLSPDELTAARLQQLEQAEMARHQQAQALEAEDMRNGYVDSQLEQLEQRTGRQFSDDELDTLEALALATPDESGLPDVNSAYTRLYEGVLSQERQRWTKSKRTVVPPTGRPGSKEIDLSDQETRVRHIAALAEAHADADINV